jgi:hypothetical protein
MGNYSFNCGIENDKLFGDNRFLNPVKRSVSASIVFFNRLNTNN